MSPEALEGHLLRQLTHLLRGVLAALAWLVGAYVEYVWDRFNIGKYAHLVLFGYVLFVLTEITLHLRGVEIFTRGSLFVQALFLLVLAISSISHYRGWRERKQQTFFIVAAARIAQVLRTDLVAADPPDVLIDKLLAIFLGNFRDKGGATVNIFLFDQHRQALAFTQSYPRDANVDRTIVFAPGKGGAGMAFQEKAVVCIPWRRYGWAVIARTPKNSDDDDDVSARNVSRFAIMLRCFIPDKVQAFESVLSVPVMFADTCYGILNLDSTEADAFRPSDFPQALFYGMVVGLYLHELKLTGRTLA